MKRKFLKCAVTTFACISALTLCVSASNGHLLSENFESNNLNSEWKTQASTNCYVTVVDGKGIQGSGALELSDKNDGTASPYYEGFAEAVRTFTPQSGDMTVEFYFRSDNIPIGHEMITLGMGETIAFEMMLNNHGQNAHIRFNNAGEYELLNGVSAHMWHRAKIKLNVSKNTCEFYLDDMDECKIKMKLTNPVKYIDRITFQTGEGLGEKSVFRIDNLIVSGLRKKVENIDVVENIEVGVGAYKNLDAKAVPYEATDKEINYSSKNPSVATVDETGAVYGVSEGNTDITLTTNDGVSKVCKVRVVKNDINVSDLNIVYDHDDHKFMVEGKSLRGEGSVVSISIKEGGSQIYFGHCVADKNGIINLEIPHNVKESKVIDLIAKFSDGKIVEKSISIDPDVLQSTVRFEKEVYVTKIGQDEKLNVLVDTEANERPKLTYGHGQKKIYKYGEYTYTPAYYVGTVKVDGDNNYYTDSAEEGDYFVSVSTKEHVKASTKALVQVNDADAAIEDVDTENSRTIKVSLPANAVTNKVEDGKQVRLAAGYIEITPNSSYLPKEDIDLTVMKKKTPLSGLIAEYEVAVSDNIKNIPNIVKFPMDFLSSSITNYNLIGVYGSDDGKTWINLKADVESGTNYMLVDADKIYPYIQIKVNDDININHFAKNDIYSLYSKGIYNESMIADPDGYVTVDQFANAIKSSFADSKNINGGTGNITREKAAVAIYNALGYEAQNTETIDSIAVFKDYNDIDISCRTALNTLCAYKIFNGDENSNINPKNNITIGELAVIISRLKQ